MKKELGILLLIFTVAVGFSGAVTAINGDSNQGTMWKKNKGESINKGWSMNKRGPVVWSGSWTKWRHSGWWKHSSKRNNFWFKGKHYRKIVRFNKFGKRTVIIIRR